MMKFLTITILLALASAQGELPPCRDTIQNCQAHAEATCVGEFPGEQFRRDCISVVVKLCTQNQHEKFQGDFCAENNAEKERECGNACGGITNRWRVCRRCCKQEMTDRVCAPKCRNDREVQPQPEVDPQPQPEVQQERQPQEEQPAAGKCVKTTVECDEEAVRNCAAAQDKLEDCLVVSRALCATATARNLPANVCQQDTSAHGRPCTKACGGITNRWRVCRNVCSKLLKERVCAQVCPIVRQEREAEVTTTKAAEPEATTTATSKAAEVVTTTKAAEPEVTTTTTTKAAEPEVTTTTTTKAAEPQVTTTTTTTAAATTTTQMAEPTAPANPTNCAEARTTCARKCIKAKCNNGVGNGADCRPGRARFNNDDLAGQAPGAPGAKLHDETVEYINNQKGENRVISDGLDRFVGDLEGTNGPQVKKCYEECEWTAKLCPKPTTTTTTAATTTTTAQPTDPVVLPERLPCANEAPQICAARAPQMCNGAKDFKECCAVFTEMCSTGSLAVLPQAVCGMSQSLQRKLCARACDGEDKEACCAICQRELNERICAEKCARKIDETPKPITTAAETKPAVVQPTRKPYQPCAENEQQDCEVLATELCGAANTRAEGICREGAARLCRVPQARHNCKVAALEACGAAEDCRLCLKVSEKLCDMSKHCTPATTTTAAAATTTTTAKLTLPVTTEAITTTATTTTTTAAAAATTNAVPAVCAPRSLATCMQEASTECAGDAACQNVYTRSCTKPQPTEANRCIDFIGNACGVTANSAACRKVSFKQCLVHAKCPKAAATTEQPLPAVVTTTPAAEQPPKEEAPLVKPTAEGRCVGKKPEFCAAAAERVCSGAPDCEECRAVFIKHCVNPLPVARQLCAHQAEKECQTKQCAAVHLQHCRKIALCARAPFPCEAREHEVCARLSHRVCGFSDRETFCRKVFYDNCRAPTVVPRENCATRASTLCGVTALSGVCRKVALRQCVLLSRCAPACTSNADCAAHPTNKCLTPACLPNGKCQYRTKACSDNVPCTEDSCDAATGACKSEITPASHRVCDDKVACTSDSCTPIGCKHTPVDDRCNDAKACTTDKCHPTTGCVNIPKDGCVEQTGPCTVDAQCDDGIECTKNRCLAGVCDFSQKVTCPDGCKPEECRCFHPLCDSDDDCAALNDAATCATARCDAKRGACVVDKKTCNKGCEGDSKKCKAVAPGTCYISTCLSNGECEHLFAPNEQECTTPCSPTQACPARDCAKPRCSPETGACVYEPAPCASTVVQTTQPVGKCEKHSDCITNILADKCEVAQCDLNTKQCKNVNVCTNGVCTAELCDDSDPCTVDTCSPTGCKHENVCRGMKCVDNSSCDDSNPCTRDLCVSNPLPGGKKCVHAPACAGDNAADKCHSYECAVNPLNGATRCLKNLKYLKDPKLYNDKECGECQTDQNCQERNRDTTTVGVCKNFKCEFQPKCTSNEECATRAGPCKIAKCDRLGRCQTEAARCDDNNLCTLDRCIVENGGFRCEHTPVKCPSALGATGAALDGQCDPKNGCGVCWVADSCNDDNACTVDECVLPAGQTAGGKCVHTPIAGFNHRWYENLWCDPNVVVSREVQLTQGDARVVAEVARDFEVGSRVGEVDARFAPGGRN